MSVLITYVGLKEKYNVRVNIGSLEYENIFIPNPLLRPEYEIFHKHQGFLVQGLHRMYPSVASELPEEVDLLLDPASPPDCDNLG